MIRIMLADDHKIFRQGVKKILKSEADLTVVGEANSGRTVIERALSRNCDMVLLDISMPGGVHGLDILKQIKQAHPKMAVIILSMYPSIQYGMRALRAGASGYLTKDCEAKELIAAIRKVHKGGVHLTKTLSDLMIQHLTGKNDTAAHESLTDREYQVLAMIASGICIRDIADKLGLSPKTVSTYRARLLPKLGLSTNEELFTYAMHHGFYD